MKITYENYVKFPKEVLHELVEILASYGYEILVELEDGSIVPDKEPIQEWFSEYSAENSREEEYWGALMVRAYCIYLAKTDEEKYYGIMQPIERDAIMTCFSIESEFGMEYSIFEEEDIIELINSAFYNEILEYDLEKCWMEHRAYIEWGGSIWTITYTESPYLFVTENEITIRNTYQTEFSKSTYYSIDTSE